MKKKDLKGEQFGRLLVKRAVTGTDRWECVCECGSTCEVSRLFLVSGRSVSCGCRREELKDENLKKYRDTVYADGTKLDALTSKALKPNNVSGVRGVVPSRNGKRWIAQIKLRGKSTRIGTYDTIEEAACARRAAEYELYEPILERNGYEAAENLSEQSTSWLPLDPYDIIDPDE